MTDLLELKAVETIGRIEAGEASADDVWQAWAGAAAGDDLNAYLWTADASDEGRAASGDPDGSLRGLPIAVKDIFCTEGVPTTAGSRILEGYLPPYTATAVRRLTEA